MTTTKQRANLKKGPGSNLSRGPVDEGHKQRSLAAMKAAKDRDAADDAEVLEQLEETPEASLLAMHRDLVAAIRPLLRAIKRDPRKVERNTIDLARELRQLSERVIEIERLRGASTEVESVLAAMEDRLGQANLGESLRPALASPR